VRLSSELLSAQQAESHLRTELGTVQQQQAASQGQVSALQQQLDSLQESLISQQRLAQQSAADIWRLFVYRARCPSFNRVSTEFLLRNDWELPVLTND